MDQPIFDLVSSQFANSSTATHLAHVVASPDVAKLAAACNRIFSTTDREVEFERRLFSTAWVVKSTVLQTMLDFDDERLELDRLLTLLGEGAEAVPAIAGPVSEARSAVAALRSAGANPKRNLLQALAASGSGPAAVVAGLQGASTPGWPRDVGGPDLGVDDLVLLRSRKDLRGTTFSSIVIPGTLRSAARPFVQDVLQGGRAAKLFILSYRGERIHVPPPMEMPAGMGFRGQTMSGPGIPEAVDEPGDQADEWMRESFWSGIRNQHGDLSPLSARDDTVPARFALFADGSGAFLPDDRSVLEISGLFGRDPEVGLSEDRLPRKPVRELEEGDLVVLRLSGSGEHLDEVADALLAKAGHGDLRRRATEWKDWLHSAIKRHGEGVVARTARECGLALRSPSYLWTWAGDGVMAPHDAVAFSHLIHALARLEPSHLDSDPEEYAREKWREMEQVKAFHHRAGADIREGLLERVRALIAERHQVSEVESIRLPGVDSGSMGLLRVSAVDFRSTRVPMSRLYQLTKIRTQAWRE